MGKKGEGGEGGTPAKAAPSPAKVAPSPAKAAPLGPAVEELPRAIVRRVVKDKLNQLCSSSSKPAEGGGEDEMSVTKDALLAFSESTRIFIHYLSATANDICNESKRQTISAEDVLKALEEIEFPEFIESLKVSLEEFRRKNKVKKSAAKAKETDKKRKLEDELPTQNGDDGAEAAEEMEEGDQADAPDENE